MWRLSALYYFWCHLQMQRLNLKSPFNQNRELAWIILAVYGSFFSFFFTGFLHDSLCPSRSTDGCSTRQLQHPVLPVKWWEGTRRYYWLMLPSWVTIASDNICNHLKSQWGSLILSANYVCGQYFSDVELYFSIQYFLWAAILFVSGQK